MSEEQQLKMPCKMPPPCAYILLLVFNGLLFMVNIFYDHVNYGNWTPIQLSYDPQLVRQRPYVIMVYVFNSIAALIFLVYLLFLCQEKSNKSEVKMICRWVFHLLAFALIMVIWIFDASQLWIYKICLYDSIEDERIMSNDNWDDPFYTFLYSFTIFYGLVIAFPCIVYLLWVFFVKAEENYKNKPKEAKYHKIFNKICYFATFISIMTVTSLNLTFLQDYETYFVYDLTPRYAFASLTISMFLPVRYLEYIFTGLALLFAAFLFVKQIFDTMQNKKKHIRRQLLVLTSALICIAVLTIDRFVEVFRYDKIVREGAFIRDQTFLKLYQDLRKVMWCYVFLLFPLGVYSIRNYWIEWKNQFASGSQTESQGHDSYHKMEEQENNKQKQGKTVMKKEMNDKQSKQRLQPRIEEEIQVEESERQPIKDKKRNQIDVDINGKGRVYVPLNPNESVRLQRNERGQVYAPVDMKKGTKLIMKE